MSKLYEDSSDEVRRSGSQMLGVAVLVIIIEAAIIGLGLWGISRLVKPKHQKGTHVTLPIR